MEPEDIERQKRLSALAESTLKFRRQTQDATDTLLCRLILNNDACGGEEFTDSAGRRCMVLLILGDQAVEYAHKTWQMPREIAGDEKDL